MAREFDNEILRQRIILSRKNQDLNQAQLAEKAGVTPAAISQIESGNRTPTIPVLQRIANVLGASMDYLLGKTDNSEFDDLLQNNNVRTFYRGFQSLNTKDKQTIENMIEFLKTKHSYESEK